MKKPPRTRPDRLARLDRTEKAWSLRLTGATIDQIAAALKVSRVQAYRDVTEALERRSESVQDKVEEYRALQLGIIAKAKQALLPRALGLVTANAAPDLQAMDRVLKLMDREAKLLGLDAPVKVAATDTAGNDIDFTVNVFPRPLRSAEGDDDGEGRPISH